MKLDHIQFHSAFIVNCEHCRRSSLDHERASIIFGEFGNHRWAHNISCYFVNYGENGNYFSSSVIVKCDSVCETGALCLCGAVSTEGARDGRQGMR